MRALSLRIAAVATLFAAVGCDRGFTAPAGGPASGSADFSLLSTPTAVRVVTRNVPLAASQSASAVIGAFGGSIALPNAGLKVVIPALALRSPTRITVTAVAGNQVAYEFEPHGIRFLTPLLVTQNLYGTSAYSGGILNTALMAGYFADVSALDPLNGTGLVSELLGVSVSALTRTATFSVFHFSGYLVATGDGRNAMEMGEAQ